MRRSCDGSRGQTDVWSWAKKTQLSFIHWKGKEIDSSLEPRKAHFGCWLLWPRLQNLLTTRPSSQLTEEWVSRPEDIFRHQMLPSSSPHTQTQAGNGEVNKENCRIPNIRSGKALVLAQHSAHNIWLMLSEHLLCTRHWAGPTLHCTYGLWCETWEFYS